MSLVVTRATRKQAHSASCWRLTVGDVGCRDVRDVNSGRERYDIGTAIASLALAVKAGRQRGPTILEKWRKKEAGQMAKEEAAAAKPRKMPKIRRNTLENAHFPVPHFRPDRQTDRETHGLSRGRPKWSSGQLAYGSMITLISHI